jgi:DNA-binding CsgD family transcriptional regulator
MAQSLARIAAFEFMQGHGARLDLLDQAEALSAASGEEPTGRMALHSPLLVRGLLLKWTDQLDEARAVLAADYRKTLDRGDEASLPFLLYNFSELECWAGNLDTAEEYALEGCRVAEENCQQTLRPAILHCLALIHAYRGRIPRTRELAAEALAACEQTGNIPVTTQVLSALGFAELSAGNYRAAISHLDRLAEATAAFGLAEPGVVRFIPDAVEALAALGHLERARSLAQQLQERGNALGRPWAQATAARCLAQIAAADGDLPGARAACERALSYHAQVPMPFDLARTLLIKGMIERRSKRKSAARATLARALSIFEQRGAPLWAEKARQELSKIAARAAQGGLTETERRVAALIAQGHSNRQIAATMFVTENTVQSHIQHIFHKLGVRSRTELAARYPSAPPSSSTASSSAT